MKQDIEYIVIGAPNDKRPALYLENLKEVSKQREGIKINFLSWMDFLNESKRPAERETKYIARLFSPWVEDFAFREAVSLGKECLGLEGRLPKKPISNSLLTNSVIAVEGMKDFLRNAGGKLRHDYPEACLVNPIAYLMSATDKKIESELFKQLGITHPVTCTNMTSAEEIIEYLKENTRTDTLYVKPRGGSAGEAISILKLRNGDYHLKTALKNESGVYTLGKDVVCLSDKSSIADILDFLIDLGSIVQEGVDKEMIEGQNFDMRMHVIDMHVPYHYLRLSNSEITNISAGGTGSFELDNHKIPKDAVEKGKDMSRKIAEYFQVLDFGSDIIFSSDYGQVYVLETNAFPSCFTGAYDEFNFYRHEIESTLKRVLS